MVSLLTIILACVAGGVVLLLLAAAWLFKKQIEAIFT